MDPQIATGRRFVLAVIVANLGLSLLVFIRLLNFLEGWQCDQLVELSGWTVVFAVATDLYISLYWRRTFSRCCMVIISGLFGPAMVVAGVVLLFTVANVRPVALAIAFVITFGLVWVASASVLLFVPAVRAYFRVGTVDRWPYPLVRLVEYSPGQMALKRNRRAVLWTVAFTVVYSFAATFVLLSTVVAFAILYYALSTEEPWAHEWPIYFGLALPMLAARFLSAALCTWVAVKAAWPRGPVHFDRDAGCLRFGRPAARETRHLDEIRALEFYPISSVALARATLDELQATSPTGERSLSSDTLSAICTPGKCGAWTHYQLNLVFADDSRLYLTSGRKPEPIRRMARRLAEFLKVRLIDKATD